MSAEKQLGRGRQERVYDLYSSLYSNECILDSLVNMLEDNESGYAGQLSLP